MQFSVMAPGLGRSEEGGKREVWRGGKNPLSYLKGYSSYLK